MNLYTFNTQPECLLLTRPAAPCSLQKAHSHVKKKEKKEKKKTKQKKNKGKYKLCMSKTNTWHGSNIENALATLGITEKPHL